MLKTAMKVSSVMRSSRWPNMRWNAEKKRRLTVLLRTSFPDGSSVGAAENLIPERFGTQPRNTAATSGNVAKKHEGEDPCSTPHFTEDEIIDAFERMAKELVASKEDIIALCRETLVRVSIPVKIKKKPGNLSLSWIKITWS